MRAWFSVPIMKGVRTGISVNPNPRARVYQVSATGQKVSRGGSALMLVGLVTWLIASRDETGRLNENFLMVIILAYAVWRTFGLVAAAIFPLEQR